MIALRTFRLEEFLGRLEFSVRHHLTASDAENLTMSELLAMATDEERDAFAQLRLSYVDSWGTEELREAVAATYDAIDARHVLTFSGAEEAIFWLMQELVGPDGHAIVTVPNYQSMETVTLATRADVSPLLMRREAHWALDLDELVGLLRPDTRVVAVNYPNNPTGYIPGQDVFRQLARLCDERGITLFCDEVYRGVELDPSRMLPQAADLSPTAVSLNVMSKAYGLPGLRVGWLATRDRELLERLEKRKHYTTICNPAVTEALAAIALRNGRRIKERNRAVIAANLPHFEHFFGCWSDLFDWAPPLGGCVCFPRYKGAADAEDFCRRLLVDAGVLVLPASIYYSEIAEVPADHFRVGMGRKGMDEALEAFDGFLRRQ
jgi:aspartate/methionine/tyrosine aminotransferase